MKKFILATLLTFSSIMSSSFAKDISEEKLEIYEQLVSLQCVGSRMALDRKEAARLITPIHEKTLNMDLFQKAYIASCDVDESVAIAMDDKGEERFTAYEKVMDLDCADEGAELKRSDASSIAQASIHGYVNIDSFVKAYKLSCDYETASAISSLARLTTKVKSFSGISYEATEYTFENNTSRAPAVEKMNISYEAPQAQEHESNDSVK